MNCESTLADTADAERAGPGFGPGRPSGLPHNESFSILRRRPAGAEREKSPSSSLSLALGRLPSLPLPPTDRRSE